MSLQSTQNTISQNSIKDFSNVKLYVIISSGLVRKSVLEILKEVIQGGADAVQLREKSLPDNKLIPIAEKFKEITSRAKTLFILNDRADIANMVDADGLHIGQSDIDVPTARELIGKNKILGVSTHNISQAKKAQHEGATYISAGPIFYTTTKDYEPPVGLDYLRQVKREIKIPFVAIGAINLQNINDVLDAGATCIAICSAIICSNNITETVRTFKTLLTTYHRTIY